MGIDTSGGWVKLHRSLLEWEWYDDLPCRVLWQHLLLSVNYEQKKWRGLTIEEGQLVTSISNLSESAGLTDKQVRSALEKLKSTGEMAIKTSNKYTIITITKWSLYQENGKEKANEGQTEGKQRATTKEYKKERNKESINAHELQKPDDVSEQVFSDFLALRKEKKAKLTPTALDGIRSEATKAGVTLQRALEICCMRSWQGFNASWIEKEITNGRQYETHQRTSGGSYPTGGGSYGRKEPFKRNVETIGGKK